MQLPPYSWPVALSHRGPQSRSGSWCCVEGAWGSDEPTERLQDACSSVAFQCKKTLYLPQARAANFYVVRLDFRRLLGALGCMLWWRLFVGQISDGLWSREHCRCTPTRDSRVGCKKVPHHVGYPSRLQSCTRLNSIRLSEGVSR